MCRQSPLSLFRRRLDPQAGRHGLGQEMVLLQERDHGLSHHFHHSLLVLELHHDFGRIGAYIVLCPRAPQHEHKHWVALSRSSEIRVRLLVAVLGETALMKQLRNNLGQTLVHDGPVVEEYILL